MEMVVLLVEMKIYSLVRMLDTQTGGDGNVFLGAVTVIQTAFGGNTYIGHELEDLARA